MKFSVWRTISFHSSTNLYVKAYSKSDSQKCAKCRSTLSANRMQRMLIQPHWIRHNEEIFHANVRRKEKKRLSGPQKFNTRIRLTVSFFFHFASLQRHSLPQDANVSKNRDVSCLRAAAISIRNLHVGGSMTSPSRPLQRFSFSAFQL